MSRNSIVWDYFKKDPSDVSKALCLECNKLYSLGSDKAAQQTLHGLKKHLEKCHKTTNAIFSKRVSEREAIQSAEKKAKLDESLSKILPKFIQPSIENLLDRTQIWPDDHPIVKRIDKSIMDTIILDMLPYTLVDGDGFRR